MNVEKDKTGDDLGGEDLGEKELWEDLCKKHGLEPLPKANIFRGVNVTRNEVLYTLKEWEEKYSKLSDDELD